MNYGYKKQVNLSFTESVDMTRAELVKKDFGILSEIDVKSILKKKLGVDLGVDYDNYIILGACNPPFAYKALQTEKNIGLLLPCNVVVYEETGNVFISAILPTVAMGMVDNQSLVDIAKVMEEKFKKVVDMVA